MSIDRRFSVCFSGYRPEKFPFEYGKNQLQLYKLHKQLETAIIKALDLGYRWFYCGMAKGFDLLAGESLLYIREENPQIKGIRLIAVLPYAEHKYIGSWGNLHNTVKTCADQIVIASPEYTVDCYLLRNKYMVDHSAYLICYWNGQEGGTAQTIRMAEKQNLFIDNILNVNKL